jgi:hypothetical protein
VTHPDEGAESPEHIRPYAIAQHTRHAIAVGREVYDGLTRWLTARGIPCTDYPIPNPEATDASR